MIKSGSQAKQIMVKAEEAPEFVAKLGLVPEIVETMKEGNTRPLVELGGNRAI